MEIIKEQIQTDKNTDLFYYIQIIKQNIKIVAFIFVISVVFFIILMLTMPKVYESSSLIEIGKFNGEYLKDPKAATVFLKSNGILDLAVQKKLVQQNTIDGVVVRVVQDGDFLKISINANDNKNAKQINEALLSVIQEWYQNEVVLKNNLTKKEIEAIKENLESSEERISEFTKEINRLKYGTREADGLILQAFSASLTNERVNFQNFKLELQKKEQSLLVDNSGVKILSSATASEDPIKPNKFVFMISGIILGLFFGILSAFGFDYLKKNKD